MLNESHTLRPARTSTGSEGGESTTSKMKRLFKEKNLAQVAIKKGVSSMGPELARKLTSIIAMEKATLRNMDSIGTARPDNAHQLSLWGEEQTEDISDVSDKVAVLLNEVGKLECKYVDRGEQYRKALKDIREIEKATQGTRDRKQKTVEQIEKLQEKDKDKETEIKALEAELSRINAESLVAEAQLVNVTREQFRAGLDANFEGLLEYGEKLAIIAGYGKHLLQLIGPPNAAPGDPPQEYHSHDASDAIITECDQKLSGWTGSMLDTDLPGHVQSKVQEGHTEVAAGPEHPANVHSERRWSSDSNAAESAAIAGETDPTRKDA